MAGRPYILTIRQRRIALPGHDDFLQHRAAAVDADDLAGHERRFVGGEIADHGGHLLHLGRPPHGNDADEFRR